MSSPPAPRPQQVACPVCWIEGVTPSQAGHYVYRCSRCGGCYACQHDVDLEHRRWRCRDNEWRPASFDDGALVTAFHPNGKTFHV